jgi:hypothetical protein
MHKGEIVEQGDHESLMRSQGTYFSLVEQQNLRLAEEEEQLAFEQRESVGIIRTQLSDENQIDVGFERKRASSVVSLTLSVMAESYGKNEQSTADEDIEEDSNEKKKQVKYVLDRF